MTKTTIQTMKQTQEIPALTSLDDDWTERTVVEPRSRRRVLRAMRIHERQLAAVARREQLIQDMLACDLYGEIVAAAEDVMAEVLS